MKTLSPMLLDFIVLFERKAKYLSALSGYKSSLNQAKGIRSYKMFDWYKALHSWFMTFPREELDLIGVQKNEHTFEQLYYLTMLNGIPEAWLEEPIGTLFKFTVNL
jgi:hypothetical protein